LQLIKRTFQKFEPATGDTVVRHSAFARNLDVSFDNNVNRYASIVAFHILFVAEIREYLAGDLLVANEFHW